MEKFNCAQRLEQFMYWCIENEIVASVRNFETICKLGNQFVYNAAHKTKGSVGSEKILLVAKKFPMLNLEWLITGNGNMLKKKIDEDSITKIRKEMIMHLISTI